MNLRSSNFSFFANFLTAHAALKHLANDVIHRETGILLEYCNLLKTKLTDVYM